MLQGIGETSVRRGTLRPSRSFVVLRGMRNHQFAVILLVKAGTLGDISVKQERHAMSNGVQPSLCELAWARDGVPSPATHPKSRLSQPNSRLCLKRRNNLTHPNYLTPDKLHLQPRGPRQSTSSTSQRNNTRPLDLRINEHYKINRTGRPFSLPCGNNGLLSLVHHDRRHRASQPLADHTSNPPTPPLHRNHEADRIPPPGPVRHQRCLRRRGAEVLHRLVP